MTTEIRTEIRTEWAAELTWPDGYTEIRTHSRLTGEPYQRRDAEAKVRDECERPTAGMPPVTARLVRRTATTTAWDSVGESA